MLSTLFGMRVRKFAKFWAVECLPPLALPLCQCQPCPWPGHRLTPVTTLLGYCWLSNCTVSMITSDIMLDKTFSHLSLPTVSGEIWTRRLKSIKGWLMTRYMTIWGLAYRYPVKNYAISTCHGMSWHFTYNFKFTERLSQLIELRLRVRVTDNDN